MFWYLMGAAALHATFMFCELFPWSKPLLLRVASRKLPEGEQLSAVQTKLVATIVHNAAIYNGIIAGGLLWAAVSGDPANAVARVLLVGAAVAGIFGTVTLKSPLTALQALVGVVGFLLIQTG